MLYYVRFSGVYILSRMQVRMHTWNSLTRETQISRRLLIMTHTALQRNENNLSDRTLGFKTSLIKIIGWNLLFFSF